MKKYIKRKIKKILLEILTENDGEFINETISPVVCEEISKSLRENSVWQL
tara:strand:- start:27 stop:176 length:150 start_codon:yes stop_codon:yes gene_type:complete